MWHQISRDSGGDDSDVDQEALARVIMAHAKPTPMRVSFHTSASANGRLTVKVWYKRAESIDYRLCDIVEGKHRVAGTILRDHAAK